MRFLVDAADLIPCAAIAAATADRKDPKLAAVRLEARGKRITVCSCSFISGTMASSRAVVKEEGSAGVDATNFLKAIRQCDGETEISVKNNNLTIKCGDQRYSLRLSADVDKMPFKPQNKFDSYSLPLAQAKEVLKLCAPATDTIRADDYRGITIDVRDKGAKIRFSALASNAAAGATGWVKGKAKEDQPSTLVSMDFVYAVLATPVKDEEKDLLEIGIAGNVVTYKHAYGYSYFALMSSKPLDTDKLFGTYAKLIKEQESSSCLVMAGILSGLLKRVLVMADKEEGNKGRLTGEKGKLTIYCHTQEQGAAQGSVITAGAFSGESWYNLRYLADYVGRVPADTEVRLTPVTAGSKKCLAINHGQNLYLLTDCEAPDGCAAEENPKPKVRK